MPPVLAWSLAALAAYLLGAVPCALLVGKAARGVDLREHGSGNLGATNAVRVLGLPLGLLVLALDAGKGLLPAAGFPALLAQGGFAVPPWLPPLLAGLAVLGHVFPVTLRFRGGKGVATSAGAFAALDPFAFACALGAFLLAVALTRWVSLGSLCAALVLPTASVLWAGPATAFGPERPRTLLFGLAAVLVFVRHRANVARLLRGAEPRLGERAPASAAHAAPSDPHGSDG